MRITITIEGDEVTVKVTPTPPSDEGQTTLDDFTTQEQKCNACGSNLVRWGNGWTCHCYRPHHHPQWKKQFGEPQHHEPQFFNHIPVRPNIDANEGVNAENHGNRGYARTGIPNSCSRCGQVNRQCRNRLNDHRSVVAWACLTCMVWLERAEGLFAHREATDWHEHPLWAKQYERLQHGA